MVAFCGGGCIIMEVFPSAREERAVKDIERAKELLAEGNFFVAVRGERVIVENERGIASLLRFASEKPSELAGASVADKIAGRAAAFLMTLCGVKEVYAEVLSKGAARIFEEQDTPFSFGVLADDIRDRTGRDVCPMERAVKDIFSPEQALPALLKRRAELTAGNTPPYWQGE